MPETPRKFQKILEICIFIFSLATLYVCINCLGRSSCLNDEIWLMGHKLWHKYLNLGSKIGCVFTGVSPQPSSIVKTAFVVPKTTRQCYGPIGLNVIT